MERQEIIERVNEIVCRKLEVDFEDNKETAVFDSDLGADSLDIVEIVMDVERSFSIIISDEDSETVHTLGDLYTLVEKKV